MPLLLILILITRAVVEFLAEQPIGSPVPAPVEPFHTLQIVLDVAAVLCVIGVIAAIPTAIILCSRKRLATGTFDARSGKGRASEIPAELPRWNWGAAGLGVIWGLYYGVWIALLALLLDLIPIVNLLWWIVMGMKGNEWAWRKNKWESVETFSAAQKRWKIWGIVFFALGILALPKQILGVLPLL